MSNHFHTMSLHRKVLLDARAHEMRLGPSEPERRLWERLRRSQLGVQFRRQVVVAGYIVDFLAPSARLVVEVDGAQHALRQEADARRDKRLGAIGFCVLRLPAQLVLREPEAALQRIREILEQP